ncbi:MAG: glycosyltransferase family 39 protein [Candidatus Lernaella stagnicola]|nr:glycosyltransferase family 39 protein [Candidatus Lernaella stagnicola]
MGKSRWLWVVFAATVLIRVWAFAASDNGIDYHHNAFDRPLFVEGWIERGGIVPDPVYPPVHFYLLAGLRLIGGDLLHAPRLLSLLCALIAFWPLVRLTERWFGERAAVWSGLAYAVFPLGVRVGVVSLEVAPYLLFLALAFERFGKAWLAGVSDRRAAWTGVLWMNLAAATRFEAWILLPVLAAFALWHDRRRGWLVALLLGAFPVVWLVYEWSITGHPFHFLSVAGGVSQVHMQNVSLVSRLTAWPRIVAVATAPVPAILALCGAAVAVRQRRGLWLLVAFALSLAVFTARTTMGAFGTNETKYAAALAMMLLPFAGLYMASVQESFAGASRILMGVALVLLVAGPALYQVRVDNQRFRARPDLRQAAEWLTTHRGDRGVVLGTRDQGFLLVHGRIPPAARRLAQTNDDSGRINVGHLRQLLSAPGVKLLVYDRLPDAMDFHPVLKLPEGDRVTWSNLPFHRVWRSGSYAVYEVEGTPVGG